jgi:hypothetical protein
MPNNLSAILLALVIVLPSFASSQQVETGETSVSNAASSSDANDNVPAAGNTGNKADNQPAQPASGLLEVASSAEAQPATANSTANKPQTENAQPSSEQAKPAPTGESTATEALKASKEEKQKSEGNVKEVLAEAGVISGKFEFDFMESYSHLTSNQLYIQGFGILPILVVGNVDVQNVRRDVFATTLTANYKLTDKLQISLSLPYQTSIVSVSTATNTTGKSVASANDQRSATTSGVGDINAGFNYQLLQEGLGRPGIYGGLAFKARNGRDVFETPDPALDPPPGSGFYLIRGSLSVSKTSAPTVLFGSISYGYAFERRNILYTPAGKAPAIINSYQPGPSVSWSGGLALSVNYDLSLNFSVAQQFSYSSRINGNVAANSTPDAITFRMGGIWRVNEKTSIDLSMTEGLSPDAPGFMLALRVPWRF